MTSHGMERLQFFLLLGLLILAPIPFGANRPIWWSLAALVMGLLLLIHALAGLQQRRPPAIPPSRLRWPLGLFLFVCLWGFMQALPILPEVLWHPLWQLTKPALDGTISGAISLNPHETFQALMRLMTYGAVFWLALQLGRNRDWAEEFYRFLGLGIALYAVYAGLCWSFGLDSLWGLAPTDRSKGQIVSGTFVNRNSFATYVGMGVIIFWGLLWRELRRALARRGDEPMKYRLERAITSLTSRGGGWLIGLVLTAGALFLSGSRGGAMATLLAIGSYLGLLLLRRQARATSSPWQRLGTGSALTAILVPLAGLLMIFFVSGERLTDRLATIDRDYVPRSLVYERSLEMAADYPWSGTGYGTFKDAFPLYRSEPLSAAGRHHKVHNSYLELFLELGLPAASALILCIGWLAWLSLRGALERHRDSHIPMIAFCATVLVALHALVDFSLQIPAVAMTYAALLGVGVAQSWSSRLP